MISDRQRRMSNRSYISNRSSSSGHQYGRPDWVLRTDFLAGFTHPRVKASHTNTRRQRASFRQQRRHAPQRKAHHNKEAGAPSVSVTVPILRVGQEEKQLFCDVEVPLENGARRLQPGQYRLRLLKWDISIGDLTFRIRSFGEP